MSTLTTTTTTVVVVDGGMVLGVSLAIVALLVVASVVGWQCYVGNVKLAKPDCSWMQEALDGLRGKSKKVGIEPAGELVQVDSQPQAMEVKQNRQDAQAPDV